MDPVKVNDYLNRSGDRKLPYGNLEENEHGFCIWVIDKNELWLLSVYGDGVYWNNWATEKAMKEGIKDIYFSTRRSPKAYIKKHGFEIIGHVLKRTV